jgi:uncharacterized SAM-binding protein YcdF (DUF218 family)
VWHRLKNLLACFGTFFLLVTTVPPVWYGQWLAHPWTETHGPVLIVLGGDLVRAGAMGETSYWRCVSAVDVWREGGVRQVVLTGDAETTGSMRDWLTGQGIPAEAILLETHSGSTRENALNTAKLLQGVPGPYLMVTSDIHTWRSWRVFQKAGLIVAPRPAPDAFKRANDWRNRWRVFLDIGTECSKIAYYSWKRWI